MMRKWLVAVAMMCGLLAAQQGHAQYVTLDGRIQSANGLPASNQTLSFTPTQTFYIPATNTTQPVDNIYMSGVPTGACMVSAQFYTNTATQFIYQCQYGVWVLVGSGGGGGGTPGGANHSVQFNSGGTAFGGTAFNGLVVVSTTSDPRVAVAADIDALGALTNNTSGQAGTAVALAATPTLCPTGQAPTGVLANGNATGCAGISGSGITAVSVATANGFQGSSSGGTTPVLTLNVDGTHYLPTTTDESNWNGKQTAGNYVTALTGDVTATGPGSAAATVAGLKSIAFCTGFTPTNGQAIELTTASSPNPCWTAVTPSGSGAALPFPGVVYGTSATTGTVATAEQIATPMFNASQSFIAVDSSLIGDSMVLGVGANDASGIPDLNLGWAQISARNYGIFAPNHSQGGIVSENINTTQANPLLAPVAGSVYFMDTGFTNDTEEFTNNSNWLKLGQRALQGNVFRALIADASKNFLQAATLTGSCALDGVTYQANQGVNCATGGTITTTVTVGSSGVLEGCYQVVFGGSSTFTLKVNGTNQTDPISSSSTWITYGDGSQSSSGTATNFCAGFRISGITPGSAAIVLTGSGFFNFQWLGSPASSSSTNPRLVAIDVPQLSSAFDPSGYTSLWQTVATTVFGLATTDSQNITVVPARSLLGANPGSMGLFAADGIHPSAAGYQLLANSAITQGQTAGIVTNTPAGFSSQNSQLYVPSTTNISQGFTLDPSNFQFSSLWGGLQTHIAFVGGAVFEGDGDVPTGQGGHVIGIVGPNFFWSVCDNGGGSVSTYIVPPSALTECMLAVRRGQLWLSTDSSGLPGILAGTSSADIDFYQRGYVINDHSNFNLFPTSIATTGLSFSSPSATWGGVGFGTDSNSHTLSFLLNNVAGSGNNPTFTMTGTINTVAQLTAAEGVDLTGWVAHGGLFKLPAITMPSLVSQPCLGTDSNGTVIAGSGCSGGSGTIFQANGTGLSNSTTVNFQSGTNITVSNPSAGDVAYNLSGQVAVANGGTGASTAAQNSVFAGPATGGTGAPSFQTSPTIAVTNMTGTGGFSITGNAATATLATTATNLPGGALGSVPYQLSSGSTSLVAGFTVAGTYGLCETPTGSAVAPTWCLLPITNLPSPTSFLKSYSASTGTFIAATIGAADVLAAGTLSNNTTGNAATATASTNVTGGVLGSSPYQTAANATSFVAPNTSATKEFYSMTGTGSAGASPSWGVLAAADLPLATTGASGAVKPDGTTITISAGVISSSGGTPAYPQTVTGCVSGGILYGSLTTQVTCAPLVAANGIFKSGGAGNPPIASTLSDSGTVLSQLALGTAVSGTNFGSPTFQQMGSHFNVSALSDNYNCALTEGTGTNPTLTQTCGFSTASTGVQLQTFNVTGSNTTGGVQFNFSFSRSLRLGTDGSGNVTYNAGHTHVFDSNISAAGTITSTLGTAAITSATPATGVTSVTCQTANCDVYGGTYTVVGGTATTGTFVTLLWPTTTTAWRCTVTPQGAGYTFQIAHSVATATGMTISAALTIAAATFTFDYDCQP